MGTDGAGSAAPAQHQDGKPPFDIVSTYLSLLSSDPDLTMPVAAIEALVSLLVHSPSLTTISETLDLLASNAAELKRSIANPISLSAGTDLFQRYIINSLQRGGSGGGGGGGGGGAGVGDFEAVRAHLLANGRLFVSRAKEARRAIAATARRFVREGSTVLTNGGSRVVSAVLQAAAEAQTRESGAPRFKVVYAVGAAYSSGNNSTSTSTSTSTSNNGAEELEGAATVAALRALGVPVATVSEAAVAYAMGKVSMALVGAEGVVENGGIISRMGTYQMAVLAKAAGKPLYVVAESHKFVRMFPLGQYDLGVEQNVLHFTTTTNQTPSPADTGLLTPKAERPPRPPPPPSSSSSAAAAAQGTEEGYFGQSEEEQKKKLVAASPKSVDAVDYTPPNLISALVTEAGVLTPSAVSEELIKIWY